MLRLRIVPAREPLPDVSEAEERAALLVLAEVLLKVRDRIRREDQALKVMPTELRED